MRFSQDDAKYYNKNKDVKHNLSRSVWRKKEMNDVIYIDVIIQI